MAKKNDARRQKKLAKHKAKRAEKRTELSRRTSMDPTIRLQGAAGWPAVEAWVSNEIWTVGIGHVLIARRTPGDDIAFGTYLVDVFCLGVKNAFWDVGSLGHFKELLRKMDENTPMKRITPECCAKLVHGAVDYAKSFGFSPHHDYRSASRLLDGLDEAACTLTFTFGMGGRPHYVRGPNESIAQARAIAQVVRDAGGEFTMIFDPSGKEDDFVEDDWDDEDDDDDDRMGWTPRR